MSLTHRGVPIRDLGRGWVLLIALTGVSLAACATGSGGAANAPRGSETHTVSFREDVIPVTRVLTGPVETVWDALPASFADLGFPSGPSASEERVYLTPSLKIHGQLYKGELNSVYIDCGHTVGGGPAADWNEVTFAMMVRLTPQDGGRTMVQVVIDGTARDRTMNLSNPLLCTGTGRLETEFLQRLEARIGSQSP